MRAIRGTTVSPKPLRPAFDMPIIRAEKMKRAKKPGVSAGCIRLNEVCIDVKKGKDIKSDEFAMIMVVSVSSLIFISEL
jgi:hypothetical protein